LKLNRVEEAYTDSNQAMAKDGNRYEGWYYKGVSYFYQGKYSEALENFDIAQAKVQDNTEAHNYTRE